MIILNYLDFNIFNSFHTLSVSINEMINIKFILLTSSILSLLSVPIFFSGPFKKGAKELGKLLGHIGTTGAGYIGGKEMYKDLSEFINKTGSGSNSDNSGNNSTSTPTPNKSSGDGNKGGSNNNADSGKTSKN